MFFLLNVLTQWQNTHMYIFTLCTVRHEVVRVHVHMRIIYRSAHWELYQAVLESRINMVKNKCYIYIPTLENI